MAGIKIIHTPNGESKSLQVTLNTVGNLIKLQQKLSMAKGFSQPVNRLLPQSEWNVQVI
jgi:hypothetical protein